MPLLRLLYRSMQVHPLFTRFYRGLIVSCQALPDEPLYGSAIMAAMACAAKMGGAAGIRANTPQDIAAIRAVVDLPIIGLYKIVVPGYAPYITPTLQAAEAASEAGADIIAIDSTLRLHPQDYSAERLIREVKHSTGKPLLADIDSYEDGLAAIQAGEDALSTTLSGYTETSPQSEAPDFDLLERLVRHSSVPVIAEGRISNPAQAAHALELGAYAVVVGGAITRPQQITHRFSNEIEEMRQKMEKER